MKKFFSILFTIFSLAATAQQTNTSYNTIRVKDSINIGGVWYASLESLCETSNSLEGLTDVLLTSLQHGDLITYDTFTHQWHNVTLNSLFDSSGVHDTITILEVDSIFINKKLKIPTHDTSYYTVPTFGLITLQPSDHKFYGYNGTYWACMSCTWLTGAEAILNQYASRESKKAMLDTVNVKKLVSDTLTTIWGDSLSRQYFDHATGYYTWDLGGRSNLGNPVNIQFGNNQAGGTYGTFKANFGAVDFSHVGNFVISGLNSITDASFQAAIYANGNIIYGGAAGANLPGSDFLLYGSDAGFENTITYADGGTLKLSAGRSRGGLGVSNIEFYISKGGAANTVLNTRDLALRLNGKGVLEYNGNVSSNFTDSSLVNKKFVTDAIAAGAVTEADPIVKAINGIVKSNGTTIAAAVSGTDYAPATSGSAILKGNGSGGFSSASAGTDYAPATSGSAVLKGNGSGGFSSASSGTDYAPATSGSAILKGNGSGGFSSASSGTDYAPATSGSGILKGNGSGGFSTATAGTDYTTPSSTETVTNKNLSSGTNTFPTLNQNTTGSAATLTTARTINGQSFNGSANISSNSFTSTNGAYTGTITWSGTAPTSLINATYYWSENLETKDVILTIAAEYTNAGVTNTQVTCLLPTGAPLPSTPTGVTGAANDKIGNGYGWVDASFNLFPPATRVVLMKATSNTAAVTDYMAGGVFGSQSAKAFNLTVTYRAQ